MTGGLGMPRLSIIIVTYNSASDIDACLGSLVRHPPAADHEIVVGTRYTMLLGRVVRFHLREGLLRPNGLADPRQLDPIARLGGDEYTTLGEGFEMIRPRG